METESKLKRTIENLDEEVLIEIFDYLSMYDLKNAAYVCLRWHTIIASTSKLARELWFVVKSRGNLQRLNERKERSKVFPFRNISFEAYGYKRNDYSAERMITKTFKEILMDHKAHIEELQIIDYKRKMFTYLLRKTGINENLTKLRLQSFEKEKAIKASDPKFDFPNLKHLVMRMSTEFLNLVRSHKIEMLTINADYMYSNGGINWKEFLKTCPNLKWLTMWNFFAFDISNLDFKLEYLHIEDIINLSDFKKFIISQKENLKFLRTGNLPLDLLNLVINELKVETFYFGDVYRISEEQSLKINTTIKRFGIKMEKDDKINLLIYENIIKSLNSVENLFVKLSNKNVFHIINFIAVSMPKLKNLEIHLNNDVFRMWKEYDPKEADFYLKIDQVEKLTVVNSNIKNFGEKQNNLLTCCPNIKAFELISHSISPKILTTVGVKVLCSLQNIEDISILDKNFEFKCEIVDTILASNIRKLTTVKHPTFEFPKKLKKSKIQTVVLEDFDMENIERGVWKIPNFEWE